MQTRVDQIMTLLRRDETVDVDVLATTFDVSTQTIRKDLSELCSKGFATRTHGGARRLITVSNQSYQNRRAVNRDAKNAIAARTAELIPSDCSVILNIGTTTERVAEALSRHEGLVVISNNVNIITSMMSANTRDLILVGGAVRRSDGAIVGEDAVEFISRYKADFAIIGASALDDDGAILDYDAREVAVSRAILKNSRTKILVADQSKFDNSASVRISMIGALDHLVTDALPPAAFCKAAELSGTQIHIAEKAT